MRQRRGPSRVSGFSGPAGLSRISGRAGCVGSATRAGRSGAAGFASLAACAAGAALGLAAITGLAAGCSSEDERCGPEGAPAGDLVVADTAGAGVTLRYANLAARANNDCPDPAAPAGVISLTLSATAVGGTAPLTFCVPRPDLLTGARALATDVQVIDVIGADATCTYRQLRTSTASGTVTATGVCNNGRDPAGFALDFAGAVTLERTCGATKDTLPATLTGKVAVLPSNN